MDPKKLKRAEELAKRQGGLIVRPEETKTPGGLIVREQTHAGESTSMAHAAAHDLGQQVTAENGCRMPPEVEKQVYGHRRSTPFDPSKFLGKHPVENVQAKPPDSLVEFYAYEIPPGAEIDLSEMIAHCKATGDIDHYRNQHNGAHFERPKSRQAHSSGYTVTKILPELKGTPYSNLILGYCWGFNPSAIRISHGEVCCDAMTGRITIFLDKDDKVDFIEQEIPVLYGSGADLNEIRRDMQAGKETPAKRTAGQCIGHTAALARCDFDADDLQRSNSKTTDRTLPVTDDLSDKIKRSIVDGGPGSGEGKE